MLSPIPLVVETGLFWVVPPLLALFSLQNIKKMLSGFWLLRGEGVLSEPIKKWKVVTKFFLGNVEWNSKK